MQKQMAVRTPPEKTGSLVLCYRSPPLLYFSFKFCLLHTYTVQLNWSTKQVSTVHFDHSSVFPYILSAMATPYCSSPSFFSPAASPYSPNLPLSTAWFLLAVSIECPCFPCVAGLHAFYLKVFRFWFVLRILEWKSLYCLTCML